MCALRERIAKALKTQDTALNTLTPGKIFSELLLSGLFLNELERLCNEGLRELGLRESSVTELRTAIGVIAGYAFCRTSFDEITSAENRDVYQRVNVNRDRILEIIVAIGVRQSKISGVFITAQGSYDRGINSIEEAFAKVCCPLFHVNGMGMAADDDVTRQR
ncbi:hypothetical protein FGB62_9g12 [Gracilaria domingensis]|nr:hypothetical protein FGB62_9g12 [Gracilaria domingensis]